MLQAIFAFFWQMVDFVSPNTGRREHRQTVELRSQVQVTTSQCHWVKQVNALNQEMRDLKKRNE